MRISRCIEESKIFAAKAQDSQDFIVRSWCLCGEKKKVLQKKA